MCIYDLILGPQIELVILGVGLLLLVISAFLRDGIVRVALTALAALGAIAVCISEGAWMHIIVSSGSEPVYMAQGLLYAACLVVLLIVRTRAWLKRASH